MRPLADRLRPQLLDQIVGQRHLLGPGSLLRRIIESGNIQNMIFYGPSGIGKTTLASIIARKSNKKLYKLNATTASISDIRQIISDIGGLDAENGILLYLDEIQYFNKKQQQSLLEFIEDGSITLIASTTENPYFYVYGAILSRSTVFEFKPVTAEDVALAVKRAFDCVSSELGIAISADEDICLQIAYASGGDVRKAINAVEMLSLAVDPAAESAVITAEDVSQVAQSSSLRYDRDGDSHYDILSALQKSVRGSDPDAAVHYLARLLAAGDLPSACRRLLVMACEDVGLAYPQAIAIVKACVDSALQLGMPEAQLPLGEAVVLMATAPKSNSSANAIWAAMADINNGVTGEIPPHLRDSHYEGAGKLGHGLSYKYPHSYPNHYVAQQYLPDNIKDKVYYEYGENKTEQTVMNYWKNIKRGE
ncbi:MAG: replication-associated recombination protein A [Clostridia bacterium]|nr:replication-associated recombination protein A [Clostridia bacterium]